MVETLITHPCGCVNRIDEILGVERSYTKCQTHLAHQTSFATTARFHFERLGAIRDGMPQCERYVNELREALTSVGREPKASPSRGTALEVGCGCSMYASWLMQLNYSYEAVEPSPWPATWTQMTFCVPVHIQTWEQYEAKSPVSLILMAHVLSQFQDAPAALAKAYAVLQPGGRLWLVNTSDEVSCHPDLSWFFNETTLHSLLTRTGFERIQIAVRRIVDYENFLYVEAFKPESHVKDFSEESKPS